MQLHTPSHLSDGAKNWLADLRDVRTFTATEWRLVQLAAEAWDRAQNARRILGREGAVCRVPVTDKHGDVIRYEGEPVIRLTAHPAVGIARDSTATFSKLVNQLGLDRASAPAEDEPVHPGQTNIVDELAQRREAS